MSKNRQRPVYPLPADRVVFMPISGRPRQLFVLFHGEGATPAQLLPLVDVVKRAFPYALIILPHGRYKENAGYRWFDVRLLNEPGGPAALEEALPPLLSDLKSAQNDHGLRPEQTALGGFSEGATLALEAVSRDACAAGRVLAFSGTYLRAPQLAPPATTLHFLHGADDRHVPAATVQAAHECLARLRGDATLDIATGVGHELHPALVDRAVRRLQTCVPLRSWEAALNDLQDRLAGEDPGSPGPTLH